jgi:molybdopterin converting factor small subunit
MAFRVQVLYYGWLKRAAGCAGETIELPEGSVLTDLVKALVSRHGPPMEKLLLTDGGELRAEAAVLVNGRNAVLLQGLATPVQQEDKTVIVVLAPALAGGAPT